MPEININIYARLIAQKLDSQDSNAGDNKIEASIWNKFVADKGGKTINNNITMENAVKSITAYLINNAKSLGKSLDALASEWLGRPVAALEENVAGADNEVKLDDPELAKKVKEEQAALEAKYNKLENIAKNEKAENGMTYQEANAVISNIRRHMPGIDRIFVVDKESEPGHWKVRTDEEFIAELEKACKDDPGLVKVLENYKKAYAAKKELETKHPELKNMNDIATKVGLNKNIAKLLKQGFVK